MIDKTIPYHPVAMVRPADVPPVQHFSLPPGFDMRLYTPGDERHWARIETAAGEFEAEEVALRFFADTFLPHADDLKERLVFITDRQGEPVADAMLWWAEDAVLGRVSRLHWVAVHPDFQGLGLGKLVCKAALSLEPTVGFQKDTWLTTQTWSWFAIGLYLSLGFRAHKSHRLEGHDNGFAAAVAVLQKVMRPKDFALFMDTAIE